MLRKVALYQGIFNVDRGLENVIRACEHLLPDVEVIFRGYGPNADVLRCLSKFFTNCRFLEPVPMEELVSSAKETGDIGIISYMPWNLNNLYASPNKLFEYIQAGLPVVAADLPFLHRFILDHQIGFLFQPNDPVEIGAVINKATRDETLARLRANVQRIKHKYSWHEEQKKLLQVFRQVRR